MNTAIDLETVLLSSVSNGLAVTLSALARSVDLPTEVAKAILADLAGRHWVREQPLGQDDLLYTITADGVRRLEEATKRGISSYF